MCLHDDGRGDQDEWIMLLSLAQTLVYCMCTVHMY